MTTEIENTDSTEIVMTNAERIEKLRLDRISDLESMIAAQKKQMEIDTFTFLANGFLQSHYDSNEMPWDGDLDITISFKFVAATKTFEPNFNGLVSSPKVKIISKSVNADSNGDGNQSIRNRFTILIDPDGNRHDAPMKNDSQNDRVGMETILGFSLLDAKQNSLSHIAKMKLLKSKGWKFESFLDSDQSEI